MANHRDRPGWSSETDWPVLLHVVIAVRRKARTKAWMTYTRTGPHKGYESRYRVDYTSDARADSLDALLDILHTMVKQVERQRTLARNAER